MAIDQADEAWAVGGEKPILKMSRTLERKSQTGTRARPSPRACTSHLLLHTVTDTRQRQTTNADKRESLMNRALLHTNEFKSLRVRIPFRLVLCNLVDRGCKTQAGKLAALCLGSGSLLSLLIVFP